MRADSNQITMRVLEQILTAAARFDVTVDGTVVSTTPGPGPAPRWPSSGAIGMEPPPSGLMPPAVDIDVRWEGGHETLRLEPAVWTSGRYRGTLGMRVKVAARAREVIWVSIAAKMTSVEDGARMPMSLSMSFSKRRSHVSAETSRRLHEVSQELMAASGLPKFSDWSISACEVEVPSGRIVPSAEETYRRFVHVALLKLDLIDGNRPERGRPIVDLRAHGIRSDELGGIEENEDDEGEQADDTTTGRRYWAGGFGDRARLDAFLAGSFWQIGWGKHESKRPARRTWERFADVQVGDWFAIKGVGGSNDLIVRYVGEVAKVDQDSGRLELKTIDVPLYKGKAPSGRGAGAWLDTLTQLERADVLQLIFGVDKVRVVGDEQRAIPETFPQNLILYGPPGTGKTYRLQNRFFPMFRHTTTESIRDVLTAKPPTAPQRAETVDDYVFVTFHQAYGYEDFIEGIRPRVDVADEGTALSYTLEDGVFKRAARAALGLAGFDGTIDEFCSLGRAERAKQLEDARPYAVFIDEINRGNVSRIFGELITLLEPDKRLGGANELIATLPYSNTKFGVPNNLYVIGTMNTADRSVEALDAALRRRFDFEELAPDVLKLKDKTASGIDLALLLQAMNYRIEKLKDRDHCLGHAYFMAVEDLDGLKRAFRSKVVPLLKEYFFGDWGQIGLVLGEDFVRPKDSTTGFAKFSHSDSVALNTRSTWVVVDPATLGEESFRRIYEK